MSDEAVVRQPRWANAEKTLIACEVKLRQGWVAFHAMVDDVEAHGREIFERAKNGEFGAVADYVAPVKPEPAAKPQAAEGQGPRALD